MTKKPETKWEIFFYGVLLTPLGFLAILNAILTAVSYWNERYYIATFFASSAWTYLTVSTVQRNVQKLEEEADEKLERVWDRINGITGESEASEPLGGWRF